MNHFCCIMHFCVYDIYIYIYIGLSNSLLQYFDIVSGEFFFWYFVPDIKNSKAGRKADEVKWLWMVPLNSFLAAPATDSVPHWRQQTAPDLGLVPRSWLRLKFSLVWVSLVWIIVRLLTQWQLAAAHQSTV